MGKEAVWRLASSLVAPSCCVADLRHLDFTLSGTLGCSPSVRASPHSPRLGTVHLWFFFLPSVLLQVPGIFIPLIRLIWGPWAHVCKYAQVL